jgi:hypothetical protein
VGVVVVLEVEEVVLVLVLVVLVLEVVMVTIQDDLFRQRLLSLVFLSAACFFSFFFFSFC